MFRYIYPAIAGTTRGWTGIGRNTVPFRFMKGFNNYTKVEVVHTGKREWEPDVGYWMYLAKGSGNYIDLGRTIVFPEHYDALKYFTGCVDCRNYTEKEMLAPNVYGRRIRKEICSRARAAKYDTIQYTHRNEGVYRYEITDLRILNPVNACGYTPAMWSGYNGVRPCNCNNAHILRCETNKVSHCP